MTVTLDRIVGDANFIRATMEQALADLRALEKAGIALLLHETAPAIEQITIETHGSEVKALALINDQWHTSVSGLPDADALSIHTGQMCLADWLRKDKYRLGILDIPGIVSVDVRAELEVANPQELLSR